VVTEEVYDKLKKQSIQFKDLEEVEKIKNIDCPISLEKFNNEDNTEYWLAILIMLLIFFIFTMSLLLKKYI
jgi:hypothetical protein